MPNKIYRYVFIMDGHKIISCWYDGNKTTVGQMMINAMEKNCFHWNFKNYEWFVEWKDVEE